MGKKKRKQYRPYDGNEFMHTNFGPLPSEIEVDEWKRFETLVGWKQEEQALILEFDKKESEQILTVSAPGIGGIRIHANQEGFFRPQTLETLEYTENNDSVGFTAADGTAIRISGGDDWKIRIFDSTGVELFVLNKDSLLIGYKDGKAERVKLSFGIEED